jgi:hypothetical protein
MSARNSFLAAQRREQREAQRRLRELERQAKEQAKLSAIEQARLEVATFEGRLEVLRSVHKEQGEVWDWQALAAGLPPPRPEQNSFHQKRASQVLAVLPPEQRIAAEPRLEQAQARDEQEFQAAMQSYAERLAEWEKLKILAQRILSGEPKAYTEALVEFNPFAEISDLGSSINFTVHNSRLLESVLKVSGRQIIPAEVKSLTASEKLSVKTMPKGMFHEIYVEYLCGCVLRVAREVFALLPVDTVLITAMPDSLDSRTGQTLEKPVLSVAVPRAALAGLDFDQLNPADAIENFQFRGEFKVSRQAEAFKAINPITPADLAQVESEKAGLQTLVMRAQKIRGELQSQIAELKRESSAPVPPSACQS